MTLNLIFSVLATKSEGVIVTALSIGGLIRKSGPNLYRSAGRLSWNRITLGPQRTPTSDVGVLDTGTGNLSQ